MRIRLVVLLFFIALFQGFSQFNIYQRKIGNPYGSLNLGLKNISSNIWLIGSYPSCSGIFPFGCRPFIVYQLDSNATLLSTFKFSDDTSIYQSYNLTANEFGELLITGAYYNSFNNVEGMFISLFDSNYNVVKTKLFLSQESIYGFQINKNSNSINVAGDYNASSTYTDDIYWLKLIQH